MPSDSSIIVVSSIIFIFSVVVEWVGTQYSQLHEGAGTLLRFYIITVIIVAETPNKAPRASCPHPITSCDPYRSSEGAGADFRWCRPAIRSVVAAAFRHGYWGQMMSSCESDGKRLHQPGGAPRKGGENLDSWAKWFCLGTDLASYFVSSSQVSCLLHTAFRGSSSFTLYIMSQTLHTG